MLGEPLNSRKSNDVVFWATSSKNGTAYDQHHLGPKEIIRVLGAFGQNNWVHIMILEPDIWHMAETWQVQ
jgi:hypothetical protein